jgi:lipopolysaccharide export system permease protein
MPNEDGRVKNVFISSIQQGRLGVMATAYGTTETMPNGDRFLVLDRGRRYEGTAGTAEYRVMAFDRYAVRIETKEARGFVESPRGKPLWDLLREPTPAHRAELLWRIGIPLAALNLAILAIPLSFVNPRAGRANNFLFALFAYMVYNNLLSVSQAWVAQGRLTFGIGVWVVHVGMFLLLIILFHRRQNPLAWGRFRWR